MTRIAVIEDDLPTSNQLAGWIRSAKSGIVIDQWFTRDEAEAAMAREHYDAVESLSASVFWISSGCLVTSAPSRAICSALTLPTRSMR